MMKRSSHEHKIKNDESNELVVGNKEHLNANVKIKQTVNVNQEERYRHKYQRRNRPYILDTREIQSRNCDKNINLSALEPKDILFLMCLHHQNYDLFKIENNVITKHSYSIKPTTDIVCRNEAGKNCILLGKSSEDGVLVDEDTLNSMKADAGSSEKRVVHLDKEPFYVSDPLDKLEAYMLIPLSILDQDISKLPSNLIINHRTNQLELFHSRKIMRATK